MISVTIQWKDNSKNETGFEVQRCQGVGCGNFTTLVILPPNTTTYTDTAVIANTSYSYRVRALKGKGKSNFSNILTVVTPSDTITPLSITCPADLALDTNSTGGRVVNFNLATASGGVPPYTIIMNPPSGSTFPVGTTIVNAQVIDSTGATISCSFTVTINFVDVNPPPPPPNLIITCPADISIIAPDGNGIIVNYTAPVGAGGTPPYSIVTNPPSGSLFPVGTTQVHCQITDSLGVVSTCSFNITVVLTVPLDPSNLAAVANSNGTVTLTWTDNSTNETGFVIERKLSTSSVFNALVTTAANAVSYVDNTVSRGLIYNYRIKAINSGGSSAYSNTATVSMPPAAPTNLQATAGNTSVTLGWNAVPNVTYTLKRGTVNGGPYGTTVITGLTTPGYTNTGLSNGTTYYYVVLSVNAAGTSANSNQASATPQAVLPDANWYISPTGSDGNSGLTPTTPFLTWAFALPHLNPGQTLGVRGGNFLDRIQGGPSGTPTSPITIKNYNGEVPWIRPTDIGGGFGAIWLDLNISYVIFDGINTDTTVVGEECVWFSTNNGNDPHHLTYQNARVICGTGASGAGAIILGSHFHATFTGHQTIRNVEISGGGTSASPHGNYGIYIATHDCLVDGFDIHDTPLGGMQIYSQGDPASNNIVRNGRFHNIIIEPINNRYWAVLVSSDNNLIANVIADNMNDPYFDGNAAFAQYYGTGNLYWNCLAVKNAGVGGYNVGSFGPPSGTKFVNCVSYQNVFDFLDFGVGTVVSNPLFGIDPLFVNLATGNYHLLSGSPARGIGTLDTTGMSAAQITAILTDKDGVLRANPPDVGPYQFV